MRSIIIHALSVVAAIIILPIALVSILAQPTRPSEAPERDSVTPRHVW